MMDFDERVIPGISSNFMFKEALARYEFVLMFLKKGMNVLDLGSGTGYGSKVLSESGARVTGVDIDPEAVKFSQKKYRGKNLKFQKGDVTNLAKFKKKYDLICSFEVIEHLKNPQKFISEIYKKLDRNGIFIFSTPNIKFTSPKGGVASPYHEKEYSIQDLKKLLRKFEVVEFYGQTKSKKAESAWQDFMKSQKVREQTAKKDRFGIRKLIPKSIKEKIWKYLGNTVGRGSQEILETADFPISAESVKLAHYFVVICRKSR